MKIIILHLSDMHFINSENFKEENIIAITNALNQSISKIVGILVIVSGDLTYSGKKDQIVQVKKFLNDLKDEVEKRYDVQKFYVVMVPGNHDVNNDKGELNHDKLDMISKLDKYEEYINKELDKQSEFLFFAHQYDCFINNDLICKKIINFYSTKIQINLINTAIFSSIEEDQGYHYLPEKTIQLLLEQQENDFIISIMHHPHHWYSWRCKKLLENALYSRSDMIFVGHEHYESTMNINSQYASVNIFSGGMLCNKGNWNNSEFHVGILDLNTRNYISQKYRWNSTAKIYEKKDVNEMIISKNRYNQLGLFVKKSFLNELTEDKYMIAQNLQEYFVFPLLTEAIVSEDNKRMPKEINSMNEFMSMLHSNPKIMISGINDSGKTILAKSIYTELSNTKVTLFINGSEVIKNIERNFKLAFEDAYSDESSCYEAFKQMAPENLAIIIDDADNIRHSIQNEFFKYILEHFGIIIAICQVEIDIDIKNRLKKRANYRDFVYYNIEPFYSDKRRKLVSNIVYLCKKNDYESQEHIISILCDVLTKQKYLYGWNPDFIVQFVKYYCNNIGDTVHNDGSIFSKVFEANLVQLIKPYAKKITVDKVLMILDKIAYGIYTKKEYPVSIKYINELIEAYNYDYASKIDTHDFLNLLINAKILKKYEDKFLFFDRNYLTYFIAREIKRKCLEDLDYEQFNRVINFSYSGLNSDILLFLTYITDNLNIIKMIMKHTEEMTQYWEEFDLQNLDIPFLISTAEQIISPYKDGDKKIAEVQQIEKEKEEAQFMLYDNNLAIFDQENDTLDLMQEIVRGISLMIILAKTLPSFEHLMKKSDKEKCVNLIYTMPLKIFKKLAKAIDVISRDLILEIKNFHEYEFRKDKPSISQIKDDQALMILKWEVISILLELMNASIGNATRENTNYFIDSFFQYSKSHTYMIEHIMGLAKRDDVLNFILETLDLFSSAKNILTKNMIQRVTKNFIINSKKIKSSEINQLNSKIFCDSLYKSKVLLEQIKNREHYGFQ